MQLFQLKNQAGDELVILAHGATMQRWSTLVGNQRRELILSYPEPQQYRQDRSYLGALVGPYANRIGQGKITIDQQQFQLQQNEGSHHLHGGEQGLQQQEWTLQQLQSNTVVLTCELADGHNGYPGPSHFQVSYRLSEPTAVTRADGVVLQQSCLTVELQASSRRPTLIGPTLHPYFNLAAPAQSAASIDDHVSNPPVSPINNHLLRLHAAYYAEVNAQNIPTGQLRKVSGSPYDFSQRQAIGDLPLDHNFVVHGNLQQQTAELTSPDGLLTLGVSSDYPGLQVYTGDHLSGTFQPRQGICLEPQFFPDSPNQKCFPFQFTRPDQPFSAKICYWLTKT